MLPVMQLVGQVGSTRGQTRRVIVPLQLLLQFVGNIASRNGWVPTQSS